MKVRLFSKSGLEEAGWKPGEGDVVLENPKLGQIVHVAMCDNNGKPLWDQFLHVEPIGAITIPVDSHGRIGLITTQRPTFQANSAHFPLQDVSVIGMTSIELPRGFPKKGETAEQTASREADEELNSPVVSIKRIGAVTANTAFNPHKIPVFLTEINEAFKGECPPDVNEKILSVDFHEPSDLSEMVANKKIYCGMTLAALALYMFSLT